MTSNERFFKSNKRLLGAVDVTGRLRDLQVPVGVAVVAAAADAAADSASDAAAVAAATSAVDDGFDCDCGDDSVASSASHNAAYKDHTPAEAATSRLSCVAARSADSGWWSRDRGVAAIACCDSSVRNRDSSASVAFASASPPMHTTKDFYCNHNQTERCNDTWR